MNKEIKNKIELAMIGKAQGIRGEVRVKTYTTEPQALADYGALYDKDGAIFEIISLRVQKNMAIVQFKNIKDRNSAEALTGKVLYISREQLPDDLEEDEFYHADLMGLNIQDAHGRELGRVNAVFDFGAGEMLDIQYGLKKSVLIPFTKAAVPYISVVHGFIQIDEYAAGLINDEDDEKYGKKDDELDESQD